MKRIFLSSLLSCLVFGQATASDLAVSLVDGAASACIGAAAVAGGMRLGHDIGASLSARFNFRRPTFAGGFYTDSAVGGLVGWCAAYAAIKLLTKDTTASMVGLVTGLVAVPVVAFGAFFMRDHVPHNPIHDMTPAQHQQHQQQLLASLTQNDVRALINMNSNAQEAMVIYMQLSPEQRSWVEPAVVTALQQHMGHMATAWMM